MKITVNDLKKNGYCHPGCRVFCKRYGIDWMDFLKNGIDSEILLATDNALAVNLVKLVQLQREEHGLQFAGDGV